MNAAGVDPDQLLAELKQIVVACTLQFFTHANGGKMAGTFNDHSSAGGVLSEHGHQTDLLVQGRRDQIQGAADEQERDVMGLGSPWGPDQTAEAVETHHGSWTNHG